MPVTIPDWLPGGGTVIGPPDAQTQPTDTSQRDALIKQLAADHQGQVGGSSQVLTKDADGKDQHYYDKYTFGDGTTIEIAPTGQVQNYVPKTDKATPAVPGFTDITQVRNKDQTISYYGRDPADGQMKKVPGLPDSAAPESVKATPSPIDKWDRIDAQGNNAVQSGKPAVSLHDPVSNTTIDLPKDPAGSVTAVGDTLYVIKPDGSSTPVLGSDGKPLTKPKDKSQFNVPGMGLVEYDPSKSGSDAYNVVIATPKGVQASTLKPELRNGKTYVPYDGPNGDIVWKETDLPADVTYTMAANDPRSKYITLVDAQGNSKFIEKAPDWKPPPSTQAGQALTPDTESPFVVTIGDNGQPVFTENKNRQSITEAQQALIQQLGIKVATGQMTEKQAQALITSATQAMTAQAQQNQNIQQGATGALGAIAQGAQTGAGLLQNRVTAATGALNNILNIAGGNKNLMSAPAGLGEQLVGGLQGWATELGGGQDVYNSAANLVRRADPTSQMGGDAATAYGALTQMLQKYRDLTGQPHPAEAIANQPQGDTGFTAPIQSNPMHNTTGTTPMQTMPNTAGAPGPISANPMLAAQQLYNRNQAALQLQQAT